MSNFTVKVRRVIVAPHPNADLLELGQVDDYHIVIAKDAFQTGDLGVYIPEQAIVPEWLLTAMGLTGKLAGAEKNRIRAMRLRGELSQGLLYHPDPWPEQWVEGMDVASELGIEKWEPPIPVEMAGDIERAPEGSIFRTYTDIENIKGFPDVLQDGEEVIMTEKLHGCLPYAGRILLPDGSYDLIGKLVNQGYRGQVMGVDVNGNIVPAQVINTFNNGPAKEFLHVTFTRTMAGRGSSYGAVEFTGNHRVYSPDHKRADCEGYVEGQFLEKGDQILMYRSEATLPPLVEQILVGKMLGDGSLTQNRGGEARYIGFGHQEQHREYVEYTLQALGDFAFQDTDVRISGYGTTMIRGKTRTSPYIADLFKDWADSNGKRCFPATAVNKLGPVALAFWYMDDGSLAHHEGQEDRVNLATNGFDEESINNLIVALARFEIAGVKYESKGWRIRLNADDAEKFFLMIAPYVCPCMRYKLPERYREGPSWLPNPGAYKPTLTWQTITDIKIRRPEAKSSATKFDLETETHNYFAHGILVHNSCLVAGLIDGRRVIASKGIAAKGLALRESATNVYWRAAVQAQLFEKLEAYLVATGQAQAMLFGEVLGVQDLKYGFALGKVGVRAFDLYTLAGFADYDDFVAFCMKYDVPRVPEIYRGPFSKAVMLEHTSGNSTIATHLREGIVIKPVHEREVLDLGRVALKSVSAEYLTRKGGTEMQ